jgi:hypothetical protein
MGRIGYLIVMGTWGTGNFENDDALDWLIEFERVEDISIIEKTLDVVVNREDVYLDAPNACRALVAIEVLTALNNAISTKLPDEVQRWVRQNQRHNQIDFAGLFLLAMKAIQRIKTDSELKELWEDTEFESEWFEVLNDLEVRLRQ